MPSICKACDEPEKWHDPYPRALNRGEKRKWSKDHGWALVIMVSRLKIWADAAKRDVAALWIASHDPRVPIGAKIVAGVAVAYALSPIDLIPDFIPVLGYFDDLILVPMGLWLAIRLIPSELMIEFRGRAEALDQLPSSRIAAIAVVIIWIAVMAAILWAFWPVPAH